MQSPDADRTPNLQRREWKTRVGVKIIVLLNSAMEVMSLPCHWLVDYKKRPPDVVPQNLVEEWLENKPR